MFAFEILSTLAFLVAAIVLVNPFDIWMPDMIHMTILALTVAALGSVLALALRERASDERDAEHRAFAGRWAFIIGSLVLVVGVVVQTFEHHLDPWLVVALAVMVLAKMCARAWSGWYR